MILEWFAKWEPIWLFIILFTEMSIGIRNWMVLEKEFTYDKEFNEKYVIPKKNWKKKHFSLPEEPLTEGESK